MLPERLVSPTDFRAFENSSSRVQPDATMIALQQHQPADSVFAPRFVLHVCFFSGAQNPACADAVQQEIRTIKAAKLPIGS
jgi:hypothetical protein